MASVLGSNGSNKAHVHVQRRTNGGVGELCSSSSRDGDAVVTANAAVAAHSRLRGEGSQDLRVELVARLRLQRRGGGLQVHVSRRAGPGEALRQRLAGRRQQQSLVLALQCKQEVYT